jgi:hypothetical protein
MLRSEYIGNKDISSPRHIVAAEREDRSVLHLPAVPRAAQVRFRFSVT